MTFNMGWPEWILVICGLIAIPLHLRLHKKYVSYTYDGVSRVLGILFTFILLYWGGFFA